jgi:thymidylate kinase
VILDRYLASTYAYQGQHLKTDQLQEFINAPKPDYLFLLDLPVPVAMARSGDKVKDRIEQKDIAFHKECRQRYLDYTMAHSTFCHVVDASEPSLIVSRQIRKYFERSL